MTAFNRSVFLLLILLCASVPAYAEFEDFNDPVDPDTWTLLGTASVQDGRLYLTQDEASQGGAIYLNTPVNDLSTITVTYDLIIESLSVTADGCAFAIADSIELGLTGGQLGYTGPGIYGVEFDTYNNGFDPTFSDHIAVIDSSAESHLAWSDFFFGANQTYAVQISVIDGEFEVKLDETVMLNHTVAGFDPDQEAYLGVTAATGALSDAYVIDNLEIEGITSPVTLDVVGMTTIVPPSGGTVVFDAFITSTLPGPVWAQAWAMVTLPNGQTVGPVIQVNLPVIPGTDSYLGLTQNVPALAPGGTYTYTAILGQYPNPVIDDSFQFEKIGAVTDGAGGQVELPRPDWSGMLKD